MALDLKAMRKRAGLTQTDLGHLLSTDGSRISKIETVRARPNPNELITLSLVFGHPIEVLTSALFDQAAYRLMEQCANMPEAPPHWREKATRADTLADIARRLEGYSSRSV